MLYDEFITGTGCKANDHNFKVYKRLEILYMNDETITKEEIYEYGKKLVDNSLTEAQLEWNADVDERIDGLKEEIKALKGDLDRYQANKQYSIENGWDDVAFWRREIRYVRVQIKTRRQAIANYKECKYV